MADIIDILEQLKSWGPLATLLALILFGSYRGIWVWGRDLREAKQARDRWESMALRAVGLAEDTVVIANRKVPTDVP